MTHQPHAISAALETLLPEGGWGCSWNEDLELKEVSFDDYVQNPPTLEQVLAQAEIEATKIPWKRLRRERDRLLAETDWVVSRAVDLSNDGLGIQLPQVWADYRQALRDLPANTTDPANPVWPVKPQ